MTIFQKSVAVLFASGLLIGFGSGLLFNKKYFKKYYKQDIETQVDENEVNTAEEAQIVVDLENKEELSEPEGNSESSLE